MYVGSYPKRIILNKFWNMLIMLSYFEIKHFNWMLKVNG